MLKRSPPSRTSLCGKLVPTSLVSITLSVVPCMCVCISMCLKITGTGCNRIDCGHFHNFAPTKKKINKSLQLPHYL